MTVRNRSADILVRNVGLVSAEADTNVRAPGRGKMPL
jgi:hypothetical protein